jgi:amidase
VTNSVRDTAALLDVLAGSEIGDPFYLEPPERPFLSEADLEPGRLRIATTLESPSALDVDEECASAVNTVAAALAEHGHEVQEDRPRWSDESLVGHYRTFYSTLFAYNREFDPAALESHNREFLAHAESRTSLDYVKAFVHLQEWVRQTLRFWEDYDLLVTPTLCKPPILLGAGPEPEDPGDLRWWGFSNYIAFLPVANLTGQPAINLPAYRRSDGLPIGVQLIGRIGDEALLLRVAAALEREMSWDRRSSLVAVDAGCDGGVDVR